MLTPKDTAHFRRDFKRLKKDGYDIAHRCESYC